MKGAIFTNPKLTSPLHILVADDEADMCVLLRDALRFLSHQPHLAPNGNVALDIAREHPLEFSSGRFCVRFNFVEHKSVT